jgi:hypothetical protein
MELINRKDIKPHRLRAMENMRLDKLESYKAYLKLYINPSKSLEKKAYLEC